MLEAQEAKLIIRYLYVFHYSSAQLTRLMVAACFFEGYSRLLQNQVSEITVLLSIEVQNGSAGFLYDSLTSR